MPIPALDENGLLPTAVHDCTLEEIEEVFGNDRWVDNKLQPCRSKLYRRLCDYLAELRRLDFVLAVLIDGSFVTDKPEPGDIDLALVVPAGYDFTRDLRPFEYNLVSRSRVKANRYLFDLFVVAEGSADHDVVVSLFHKVKHRPELTKGFLRIRP